MVKEGVDGDCETVEMSRVVSGSEASSCVEARACVEY